MTTIFLILFLCYSIFGCVLSLWQVYKKHNFFGLCPVLLPLGAFVWVDGVIFSVFWIFILGICLILKSFLLFLLVYSVFWAVRSLGEVIYWIHEQFTTNHRNPPHTLGIAYKLFPNESVWIAMQIFWQIMLVLSILCTIVLGTSIIIGYIG